MLISQELFGKGESSRKNSCRVKSVYCFRQCCVLLITRFPKAEYPNFWLWMECHCEFLKLTSEFSSNICFSRKIFYLTLLSTEKNTELITAMFCDINLFYTVAILDLPIKCKNKFYNLYTFATTCDGMLPQKLRCGLVFEVNWQHLWPLIITTIHDHRSIEIFGVAVVLFVLYFIDKTSKLERTCFDLSKFIHLRVLNFILPFMIAAMIFLRSHSHSFSVNVPLINDKIFTQDYSRYVNTCICCICLYGLWPHVFCTGCFCGYFGKLGQVSS